MDEVHYVIETLLTSNNIQQPLFRGLLKDTGMSLEGNGIELDEMEDCEDITENYPVQFALAVCDSPSEVNEILGQLLEDEETSLENIKRDTDFLKQVMHNYPVQYAMAICTYSFEVERLVVKLIRDGHTTMDRVSKDLMMFDSFNKF